MPRVYLSESERLSAKLASWVYGELKIRKIPQRVLADELQISQPALNQKLRSHNFSFADFTVLVRVLQPDLKELEHLLGR